MVGGRLLIPYAITPKWFMSNDAEQFHSAWTSIFGGNPQKLLCTWHVDRTCRKSLSKVTDKQCQISVYHTLLVLLEERDVERFDVLLQNAVLQWREDPSTVKFYKYFTQPTIHNVTSSGQCATEREHVLTQTCLWRLSIMY